MKKKISLIIIIIFFFTVISTFGFPIKLFGEEISVYSGESIQSSINSALANSTDIDYVYIDSGTYLEQLIINIPSSQEIHLIGDSSDTTIISLPSGITGNVISADGGGKIYLEKVKITNGTRSGIRINNSTKLDINYCDISNNGSNIGGGIYNYGSILNINNSKIINNNSTLYGGGIYNDGTINVTNSLISNNSSITNDGGGIYNLGNLTISGCSIYDNASVNYSGIASISEISGIVNTAENNWWGSESGPYNSENNPFGAGDSVADNVDFHPFLLSDPFSGEPAGNDGQSGDDNSQIPSDSEGNNTSENSAGSSNNNPYGNIYFSDTGNFPLDHYLFLYDSPSRGFIELLYNSILLRDPDAEGFNHWGNLLHNNIKSASDIAECLFFSEENTPRIKNTGNIEFLEYLYSGILFRMPDKEGFNNWLTIINDNKAREYLFISFVNSKEWKDICSEFNVNP